jgi:hypothetical protein
MKREYNLNGLKITEFKPDDPLMVTVKTYTPHSCPWDYCGNKWMIEMGRVLAKVGIKHECCVTHRQRIAPQGTGPGGRVRFGDDMVPSEYRLYVSKYDDVATMAAINKHEAEVREWLYNHGPRPEAIE